MHTASTLMNILRKPEATMHKVERGGGNPDAILLRIFPMT
jgi:hypothetical protein